jgi:cysteine-rich repeat protein
VPSVCTEVCGDGQIIGRETCDDEDNDKNDNCPSGVGGSCRWAYCGDGFQWNTDGGSEECDDGNSDNHDACIIATGYECKNAYCGDGFVWNSGGTEQCDDANGNNNDSCVIAAGRRCMNAYCGDGFIWNDGGPEHCDDGNTNPDDGCDEQCQVEAHWRCSIGSMGVSECECQLGYKGDTCDACTDGYFEYPASTGTCIDNPCLPDPCGIHALPGSCDNSTGEAVCTCETDFAGDLCDACSDGSVVPYPGCFVPQAGYCDFSQCFSVVTTNQTSCYDTSTTMMCTAFPCDPAGTPVYCGQDAQYQKPARAFTCYNASGVETACSTLTTASNHEVVMDWQTGLMWQRILVNGKDWDGATDYCARLDYAGHTDWRVPNPHEMWSLYDWGTYNVAIDSTVFPGSPFRYFWTSATSVNNSSYAFYGDFYSGGIGGGAKNYYATTIHCVRLGRFVATSPGVQPRFIETEPVAGQQVVRDAITGLMWAKQYVTGKAWQAALLYCEGSNHAGFTDWRLPDINELFSLTKFDVRNPASDFPGMLPEYFWSSTSDVSSTGSAWYVYFVNGSANSTGKGDTTLYTRCVRL